MVLTYLHTPLPHPDIFWHSDNWISESIKKEVRRALVWQPWELRELLGKLAQFAELGDETWGRGTLGQSLYHLFIEDQCVDGKLEQALRDAVLNWEDEVAFQLLCLAVHREKEDPRGYFAQLISRFPRLMQDIRVQEMKAILEEFGWIDIF